MFPFKSFFPLACMIDDLYINSTMSYHGEPIMEISTLCWTVYLRCKNRTIPNHTLWLICSNDDTRLTCRVIYLSLNEGVKIAETNANLQNCWQTPSGSNRRAACPQRSNNPWSCLWPPLSHWHPIPSRWEIPICSDSILEKSEKNNLLS